MRKIVAVIAADTGMRIKAKLDDGTVQKEWVTLTAATIGVLARTCTPQYWSAIQYALQSPGVWIYVDL